MAGFIPVGLQDTDSFRKRSTAPEFNAFQALIFIANDWVLLNNI